jgi:hypothetical protein
MSGPASNIPERQIYSITTIHTATLTMDTFTRPTLTVDTVTRPTLTVDTVTKPTVIATILSRRRPNKIAQNLNNN